MVVWLRGVDVQERLFWSYVHIGVYEHVWMNATESGLGIMFRDAPIPRLIPSVFHVDRSCLARTQFADTDFISIGSVHPYNVKDESTKK